jgi:hypothetical protein
MLLHSVTQFALRAIARLIDTAAVLQQAVRGLCICTLVTHIYCISSSNSSLSCTQRSPVLLYIQTHVGAEIVTNNLHQRSTTLLIHFESYSLTANAEYTLQGSCLLACSEGTINCCCVALHSDWAYALAYTALSMYTHRSKCMQNSTLLIDDNVLISWYRAVGIEQCNTHMYNYYMYNHLSGVDIHHVISRRVATAVCLLVLVVAV